MARTKKTAIRNAAATPSRAEHERAALKAAGKHPPAGKAPRNYGGKTPSVVTTLKATGRKKRRARNGSAALREIRRYQKSTESLIPKLPFQRLVREISQEIADDKNMDGLRFQAEALLAMQEAAEKFLVQHFEASFRMAIHGKRITLLARDSDAASLLGKMMGAPIYNNMTPSDGRLSPEELKRQNEDARAEAARVKAFKAQQRAKRSADIVVEKAAAKARGEARRAAAAAKKAAAEAKKAAANNVDAEVDRLLDEHEDADDDEIDY
jgi:histone H3